MEYSACKLDVTIVLSSFDESQSTPKREMKRDFKVPHPTRVATVVVVVVRVRVSFAALSVLRRPILGPGHRSFRDAGCCCHCLGLGYVSSPHSSEPS